MGLEGLFDWILEQARYLLFIALIAIILITGFKRAWIAMAGGILGLTVVGIFILNPEILTNLSEWATERLNLN